MKVVSFISALIVLVVSVSAMPTTDEDRPRREREECRRDCERSRDSCQDSNRHDEHARVRCDEGFRKTKSTRLGRVQNRANQRIGECERNCQ